jgi:antitoxin CptB
LSRAGRIGKPKTVSNRHARPFAGHPRLFVAKDVDGRVKPGHDDQRVLTFTQTIAISTPPGTSGLLAFGLESQMTGSTRSSDGLDARRRRLLFRCWHRGTREMDLVLGRFADAEIANLRDEELAQLERLIEVPDPDLYAAVTGDKARPPELAGGLFDRIKSFRAVDQAR